MQVFGQFEARDWRRRIIVLALVMILLIGLWRATKQQGGRSYTVSRPVATVLQDTPTYTGKRTPYPSAVVTIPAHAGKH